MTTIHARKSTETVATIDDPWSFVRVASLDLLRPQREKKVDDTLVGQRRDVADVLVADRDLPQHPSHYLAGSSFRQTWSMLDYVRLGERTDSLANC